MIEVKNVNICNTSKKLMRSHEGWMFQWTTPKDPRNIVIPVVPGPFVRPKLVQALPYFIANKCICNNPSRKMRDGIPDPWLEYLNWKNICHCKQQFLSPGTRIAKKYQGFTEYIWNEKGLAMVQGIPDPWKYDIYCTCTENNCYKNKQKKSKKKKIEIVTELKKKDKNKEINKDIHKPCDVIVDDFTIQRKKLLKNQDAFDILNKKLSTIKTELKIKENQSCKKIREIDKSEYLQNGNKKIEVDRYGEIEEVSYISSPIRHPLNSSRNTKFLENSDSETHAKCFSNNDKIKKTLSKEKEDFSSGPKTICSYSSRSGFSHIKKSESSSLQRTDCSNEDILIFKKTGILKEINNLSSPHEEPVIRINSRENNDNVSAHNSACSKNCRKKNCSDYCLDVPKEND